MSAAMPIVTIEFYDSGVRVCDDKNILADSISCALVESNKTILVGEQAEHQAHLRPREISTNFWGQLSTNSDTKHVISNAEIALRHLEYVWNSANCSTQAAILITPTTFDKHDLGLLLGICKKLAINVAGIACNAALAMQHHVENCKAVFLDLLQQKLAVTELIQSDSGLSLKLPSRVINYGLQSFVDNCAQSIANKYIAKTRFDPLHSAKDEQQFFDMLPFWLKMLADNNSIECKLNTGDKHFTIEIDNEYLKLANRKLFDEIAAHLNVFFHSHDSIAIFCSSACKQVFDLQEFLSSLPGCAIVQLNQNSMAEQALRCHDEIISDEQVHYVNALSWHESSSPEALHFNTGKLSNLSSMPTHILINGHAYSLQQDIFIASGEATTEPRIMIDKSPDSLCKLSINSMSVEVHVFDNQTVTINDRKVEVVSPAKIGDVLAIANYQTDCVFIKVVQDEA